MNIVLNGEARVAALGDTLTGLIQNLDLIGKRLAIEVNEEVIPRSEYAGYRLNEGDRVEIVHAIGGG